MFTHNHYHIPDVDTVQLNGVRFYNTPNGSYPSITSVLGSKKKEYLENWRNMLGQDKADKETKRCADRGTAVHDMCEKYLNNELDPTKGHELSNIKLFNQIKMRLNKIDNIIAQEVPLYSDYFKVAGRVDCIAEYNGVLSIIDFKTSNKLKTEDMILDYYIQETFYALAFYEMTGIEISQIVTIMCVEKSILSVVWVKPIIPYITKLNKRVAEYYSVSK
jgi:hypothetical protein